MEMRKRRITPSCSAKDDRPTDAQDPKLSEDEKKMTLEEKLSFLDNEIRTLHQFCVTKGYNPREVEKTAGPLLEVVSAARRRRLLRWLPRLAILGAFVLFCIYIDPAYRLVTALAKVSFMKVLPYWDWSQLHNQDCLMENPYYLGQQLTEDDCQKTCDGLDKIERLKNTSIGIIAEDYLKRDKPVIVTDGIEHWPAMEKFSISFLNNLYATDPSLKTVLPCDFTSNIKVAHGNARALLRKGAEGDISNWFGSWSNCEKLAVKAMRRFFSRPYFIPPMVEMAEENWLFVSSDFKSKTYKLVPMHSSMIFISQLRGNSKIQLVPRSPCNSTGACPKLLEVLTPGETLVVTDLMWSLYQKPQDSNQTATGENIMLAAAGNFD